MKIKVQETFTPYRSYEEDEDNAERQCRLCRKCFKERLGNIFVDYFEEVDDEQAN